MSQPLPRREDEEKTEIVVRVIRPEVPAEEPIQLPGTRAPRWALGAVGVLVAIVGVAVAATVAWSGEPAPPRVSPLTTEPDPPPAPTAEEARPEVAASTEPEEARRVRRARRSARGAAGIGPATARMKRQVRGCYTEHADGGRGKITVAAAVNDTGRVTGTRIVQQTVGAGLFARCVEKVATRWRLKGPAREVQHTYRLP